MNPGAEVLLVAQREIRKNLRSAKGVVLLVLSLLGGAIVALILAFVAQKQHEILAEQLKGLPPEAAAELTTKVQRQIILQLGDGDEALGDALAKAPGALLGVLKVTVWIGPALIAILGFDAVSGEIQHRTVRFWTVRSRRASFYVGKVLGLWAVVSLLTLLVHLLVWIIVIARGETAGAVLEWGPRLWGITLPISLVWCAIAQLVGSQFRQPILSLLVTFASFFGLWIGFVLAISGKAPPLLYLYPNAFDTWLIHPHVDRLLEGLAICVGSAAVYIGAGAAAFVQRDV
jgi:ABC-type transport system involved in multi-copper enzyme maturation permease subunit